MLTQTVYAAVRKTKLGEDIDLDTIELTHKGAYLLAKDEMKLLSSWSRENPVIRIGKFRMVEIAYE